MGFAIVAAHTVNKEQHKHTMRTKTLLLAAAAALAAGILSSSAQVYSANVVGYVSFVVSNGLSAYTTPLDFDGTGTNNTVINVIGTNLPVNSQVLTWNGVGYSPNSYVQAKGGSVGWQFPNTTITPGQGYFINNPSNTVTVTIVGTVEQGGLTNGFITGAGYSFVGSLFPAPGGITSTYGYTPSLNDQVLVWNGSGYSPNSYVQAKGGSIGWQFGEPQLSVGQAVFINTTNTHPVWGTNFVVQ
jgi:hypothetical protein